MEGPIGKMQNKNTNILKLIQIETNTQTALRPTPAFLLPTSQPHPQVI